MKISELEQKVMEELDKISIPRSIRVDIEHSYSFENKKSDRNVIMVLIYIAKEDEIAHDKTDSYFDFDYNKKKRVVEEMNIGLEEELQGKGYAKKLIKMTEKIARDSGFNYVGLGPCWKLEAMRFWEHMGYNNFDEKAKKGWKKYIKRYEK
jgi:GNAT superfamily N-acetyltransferase